MAWVRIKSFFLPKPQTPLKSPSTENVIEEEEIPERATWGGKLDFLLALIGYAVGLGNVWRFPYLCYRNGGGAFLIPYILMLALAGLPMFFMELALGQYASLGAISIWKLSPLFKGIGMCMCAITFMVTIYYNVIVAYTIFYFFASFTTSVPWASCDNWWNTNQCYRPADVFLNATGDDLPCVEGSGNMTICSVRLSVNDTVSPAMEYWHHYVLRISSGIDEPGTIQWHLALSLLLAWVVVFLCIIKGVKSTGKVVYFTATFPYFVLFILLIRGVTLPGSLTGIKYYLTPDFHKLKSARVWGEAAVQIFYSLGPGWGSLITLSSYNPFKNNCYRDAVLVSVINCGTSIFAGFVIFSVIGFMAESTGQSVASVADTGPGLAFVAYPEGISRMPVAPLWSVLFFFMLFTLGLDSQFCMMETLISAVVDEYPAKLRRHQTWITLAMCIVFFLLGLPQVTNGGMYLFTLMDWYVGYLALMVVCLCETLVICWVYGLSRFNADIESMIGFKPNYYWLVCWTALTPLVLVFIIIFSWSEYVPVSYKSYVYPAWAEGLGWLMSVFSIQFIPMYMLYKFIRYVGTWEKLRSLFTGRPTGETWARLTAPDREWGPAHMVNGSPVAKKNLTNVFDSPTILDDTVVNNYKTMDDTVVNNYKTMDDTVVNNYKTMDDTVVNNYKTME